jgi:propanediol dehydratase large subunit
MSRLFEDVSNWDVSNVVGMNYMFYGNKIDAKDFKDYNKKQEPVNNMGIFMDVLEL